MREKLLKLGPYAAWLQRRWGLASARAAGSLRIAFLDDYRRRKAPLRQILLAHHRGWSVDDWRMCCGGMTPEKAKGALSTVDYRRMHPLNGAYSSWVDDKLVLKYLCGGAGLADLMPDYYFQVIGGRAAPLPDCPEGFRSAGVVPLLLDRGALAIKKVRGSLGEGFYKAEASRGKVLIDGKPVPLDDFEEFVAGLEGYIVTEYLRPHPAMRVFSANTPNTVRYLVANEGGEPVFLKAFIRFGTKASGFVENYNSGGVLCFADEGGRFYEGNVMDLASRGNRVVARHPDTGEELSGVVPLWGEMVAAAAGFCRAFPQLSYLGFDFVATEGRGVRMLEINSLSSLDAIQLDHSVFDCQNGWWFERRLVESRQEDLN